MPVMLSTLLRRLSLSSALSSVPTLLRSARGSASNASLRTEIARRDETRRDETRRSSRWNAERRDVSVRRVTRAQTRCDSREKDREASLAGLGPSKEREESGFESFWQDVRRNRFDHPLASALASGNYSFVARFVAYILITLSYRERAVNRRMR